MELYRNGLKLTATIGLDESRGSVNVPVRLLHNEKDEYLNYTEQIHIRYLFDNQVIEEILPTNDNGFYIPGKPLSHNGPIELAVHLINGNVELVTNELSFIVNNAPNGTTQVDPSEFTWQQLVDQYVNAKLDTFADKADMNEFKGDVNANLTNQNSKITTLESRMDTFTSLKEGSTTGDAELTDVRVGADGTKYTSAGKAVREQVSKLKEDLVYLNGIDWSKSPFNNGYLNKVNIGFEVGNIDSTGADTDSDIRVRTNFFTANEKFTLIIPALKYRLFSYSLDGTLESATDYETGGITKKLSPTKKYKMVFATDEWKKPDITALKKTLLGFYGSLRDYINSVVFIPFANINNALQYGFNNSGMSSHLNDDTLTKYLTDHGEEPLYFPKGRYIFANPVTISSGCKFYLDTDAIIEYNQYGGHIGDFVTIENPDNNRRFIKGGKIECNSLANTGIRILNAHYFALEDISINNPKVYGISIKGVDEKEPAKSCLFNNIRIKRADISVSNDTYGIYDVGYDNTFKEICAIDFKFGMLCGGGAKVIDCHPWQSKLSTYEGSCAYMVEHSTVEFENCVIDTFQRGIKVRGSDNITVTANNLRVFNNSDVVNSGEMTIFQGTNVGSTYCYPILHVSNISINDWGGNTKLIDFELPPEIKMQYFVAGVTQRPNILNDSFTLEKRLSNLEKA